MSNARVARWWKNSKHSWHQHSNEPVTAPGIPPEFPNPKSLVTTDCIRPAK
jgi:hypothetical protein